MIRLQVKLTILFLAATFIPGGVSVSAAQQPAARVDVEKLGPQVGSPAPKFELKDQFGKSWSRDSLMGSKGLMLVFYRSADW
jgi:cytochrome oxidase Cu insertion factor (SCO1/SenC/PrrC family)